MPIRINLLAEAQAAEESRRRDPVKRIVVGGILALAGMLVWCSTLQLKVMMASRELSSVQIQFDSHTNDYQVAIANNAKIAAGVLKIAELKKMTNCRLLQGNLLNALQKVNVDNVRLMGIHVDQSYMSAGKPQSSVTEKIMVTLDARDYSANPGDQVAKFRDALAKQNYFQSMLIKTNGILLAAESPPQDDGGKSYVSFTLQCLFPDQKR
jgi:hypothetical protein